MTLICVLVFLSGCNSSKNKTDLFSNGYLPLERKGSMTFVGEVTGDEFNLEYELISEPGKIRTYSFSSFPFFWFRDSVTYLNVDSSGEVSVTLPEGNLLMLKSSHQIKPGSSWKTVDWNVYVTDENSLELDGVNYPDVIKINYTMSISFDAEIWYSHNVGIIKWGFNRANPPSLVREYYTLKR